LAGIADALGAQQPAAGKADVKAMGALGEQQQLAAGRSGVKAMGELDAPGAQQLLLGAEAPAATAP